jgi:hypothetical protein
MRTDEELKQIAEDMYKDLIFTSNHVRKEDSSLLSTIFMPLAFMDEKTRKEWKKNTPYIFFEYMSKAGPRAINGYPIFWSAQYLYEDDYKKVLDYYNKIESAVKKAIGADNGKEKTNKRYCKRPRLAKSESKTSRKMEKRP